MLEIGQYVSCTLYDNNIGLIVNVKPLANPLKLKRQGGVIQSGSECKVDVIFQDGQFSGDLPEAIFYTQRQWFLDTSKPLASEIEIARFKRTRKELIAELKAEKEMKEKTFQHEIDVVKSNEDYKHLKPIDKENKYNYSFIKKNIQAHLKKHFKGVKFSCRKRAFLSLVIEWEGLPTTKQVKDILSGFEENSYTRMDDCRIVEEEPFSAVFGCMETIHYCNKYTDKQIQTAISELKETHSDPLFPVPSVAEFRNGTAKNMRYQDNNAPVIFSNWDKLIREFIEK